MVARIGISGWTYKPWRNGPFYPKGLSQKEELHFASRHLNSIEINGTFYSLQRPSSFNTWRDQTPDDFLFSIKGGRFITHIKRLKDCQAPLANFFASGVLNLGSKLGPILWQLPPNFLFNAEQLESFFDIVPRDTRSAARLAKQHDERMAGHAATKVVADQPIRYALEVRHESFKNETFVNLMRKHDVAIVIADTAGKWPVIEDVTSDFLYLRLHGDEAIYVSGYSDSALDQWAEKLEAWQSGKQPPNAKLLSSKNPRKLKSRDVYVYFDNDVKVRSPRDAMALAGRLGIEMPALADHSDFAVNETARDHWPGVSGKAKRKKRST